MPALEIVPPSSWQALDDAFVRLADFDWLLLTSANSVDYFFERLSTQIRDVRALAAIKIAVIGEKTAQKLEQRGLKPDFVPPEFVADSLAAHFPGSLEGASILFPRVESGGRDVLVKDFVSRGAAVTEVAAYQSRCPEAIAPEALTALQKPYCGCDYLCQCQNSEAFLPTARTVSERQCLAVLARGSVPCLDRTSNNQSLR